MKQKHYPTLWDILSVWLFSALITLIIVGLAAVLLL